MTTKSISIIGDINADALRTIAGAVEGEPTTIKMRLAASGVGLWEVALACYDQLATSCAHVTVDLVGYAAGPASVIALAADMLRMPNNCYVGLSSPIGKVSGNADEVIAYGEFVASTVAHVVDIIASKTKRPKAEVRELMDRETFLDPKAAKALGLPVEIIPAVEMAASLDITRFRNAPFAAYTEKAASLAKPSFETLGRDFAARRGEFKTWR